MPRSKIEVLRTTAAEDVRRWDQLVDSSLVPDVYYRPAYVQAYERAGRGQAVGLLVEGGTTQVLIPLLLRPLSELGFSHPEQGADAFTPYGYGGLSHLGGPVPPPPADVAALVAALREWCLDTGIVCCLLRLHPMLGQEPWFASLHGSDCGISLRQFGPTTAVNLTAWDAAADCLTGMRKGRRSDLKAARRQLRVTWTSGGAGETGEPANPSLLARHLDLFYELYEGDMNRLNATAFYHFPREYYTSLATGLGSRLGLALAWHGEQAVGGSLFMADRCYGHYHLSAGTDLGRRLKAGTLLINAGAAWTQQRGCRMLHLGGGVRAGDSLFEFKKGFGGVIYQYSFVTLVADTRRYTTLVELRLREPTLPPPRPDFFPVYRA